MKTFAPLPILYKYAAFISKEFEDAVYKAFTSLTQGDTQKAAEIAGSVAIPPELIEKHKKLRETLNSLISEMHAEDKHAHSNFNRLASKAALGYTPKELTNGVKSAIDYVIEKDHYEAMAASVATLQLMSRLVSMGLDYHQVATALEVETSKNKNLLRKFNT